MSFFGLTDPWIWGAYVACFACAILCIIIYMYRKDKEEDADE